MFPGYRSHTSIKPSLPFDVASAEAQRGARQPGWGLGETSLEVEESGGQEAGDMIIKSKILKCSVSLGRVTSPNWQHAKKCRL